MLDSPEGLGTGRKESLISVMRTDPGPGTGVGRRVPAAEAEAAPCCFGGTVLVVSAIHNLRMTHCTPTAHTLDEIICKTDSNLSDDDNDHND